MNLDLSKLLEPFTSQIEGFQKKIQKSFETMVIEIPGSLLELAKYGWYIDMDFLPITLIELGQKIKNGEIDIVVEYLCDYYSEKLDYIKIKLCREYPSREAIFKEAFNCFNHKKYFASISLFLTQADGICYDKTEKLFFLNNRDLKRNGQYVPEVEAEIQRISGGFMDLLLEPIKRASVINENIGNISNFPVNLNRHSILHGMQTDYGTKTNCLKIISFIMYLNEMLEKN
jgi:hypothetical protein